MGQAGQGVRELCEHMFAVRGTPRPAHEIEQALALLSKGLSDYGVARTTGVPRSTVLNWRHGSIPKSPEAGGPLCSVCGAPEHDLAKLPAAEYS